MLLNTTKKQLSGMPKLLSKGTDAKDLRSRPSPHFGVVLRKISLILTETGGSGQKNVVTTYRQAGDNLV